MSEMMVNDSEVFSIYSNRALKLLEEAYGRQVQAENERGRSTHFGNVGRDKFLLDESVGVRGHSSLSDSEDDGEGPSDQNEEAENGIETEEIQRNASQGDSMISSKHGNERAETSNRSHKKNKKKTKDELLKQMGSPPKIAITLSVDTEEGSRTQNATALQLPAILLVQKGEESLHGLYTLSHNLSSSGSSHRNLILVLTLQSGRFAAALFHKRECIKHTTSTRYTSRKGQGGAQSSNDNSKGKANSIGSQLRRAGEAQLRQDVASTLLDWKEEIERCSLYFISISKTLQKGFWDDAGKIFGNSSCELGLYKKSANIRNIPLDVGRPSFEGCCAIYNLMTTCILQHIEMKQTNIEDEQKVPEEAELVLETIEEDYVDSQDLALEQKVEKIQLSTPLTPLHLAARDGSIDELKSLLDKMDDADDLDCDMAPDDIDVRAGIDNMTALHYAASARDANLAAKCVFSLLVDGHANPCILDSRNRPSYFLASNESVRHAFRKARAELGENIWDWEDAKIGPPLSKQDMVDKRKKAAEKKKRQRQKQKERKAKEMAEKLEEEKKALEEAERRKKEENLKRVKDGLKPKKMGSKSGRACDLCETICKRQSQMFSRLDYYYCSTDCVKRHQRELMAAAAVARLDKS